MPDSIERFRGCLLGGAVGDALGGPVEFWSIEEICRRLGPAGVTGFVGGVGEVTDDTQMTLFTAEGLIRASVRLRTKGICHPPSVVHNAYLRWLTTQGVSWRGMLPDPAGGELDGWLVHERRLRRRKSPGNTCLSALESGRMGAISQPLNDSKGCGGVMRVAPVGLFLEEPDEAFSLACELAAITHGHPSGWLPAGVFAHIISQLIAGTGLEEAVFAARAHLQTWTESAETAIALDRAVGLIGSDIDDSRTVESLGAGSTGEEALAIAIWSALSTPDPRGAVLRAVNHSGDSDSTGALCGNLVGAVSGLQAIPREWIDKLDVTDIVLAIADDLWRERFRAPTLRDGEAPTEWFERYPGW